MEGEDDMTGQIFDDVRRILLSLLFVLAFGWMAAQVLPGQLAATAHPQLAEAPAELVPPRP